MNYAEILKTGFNEYPNQIAIHDGLDQISFKNLERDSGRFASYLQKNGVCIGDKVIIFSDKTVDFMKAYLGILKAGGVAIPLNHNISSSMFTKLEKLIDPVAIIGDHVWENEVRKRQFYVDIDNVSIISKKEKKEVSVVLEADDLATVFCQFDREGEILAQQLYHGSINDVFSLKEKLYKVDEKSKYLNTQAYHEEQALLDTLFALYKGSSVFNFPMNMSGYLVSEMIEQAKITHLIASQKSLNSLSSSSLLNLNKLTGVQYLLTGPENLSETLLKNYLAIFPNLKVVNGYKVESALLNNPRIANGLNSRMISREVFNEVIYPERV